MSDCWAVMLVADVGYVKLYRKIWENEYLNAGERFTRMTAWIWIITHANYKDGSFMKNGQLVHVKRGQLFTSIRHLALTFGWDPKTVVRFLGYMETEKMITTTGMQRGTLITVRKYNDYQAYDNSVSEQGYTEGYTEGRADSHDPGATEGYITKEVKKNIKKPKKETRGGQVIE